jgi:hypothetical protein
MQEERKQSLPPLEPASSLSRSRRRKYLGLGIAMALLVGVVTAGYYYSRPIQEKYQSILAQWPALQQSVSATSARVNSLENDVRAWAGDRRVLEGRMTKLESQAGQTLKAAKKQAEETALALERRLEARTNRRLDAVESRVDQLDGEQEAAQQQDSARLARLEQDVAALRQDATRQIATVRHEGRAELVQVDQKVDRNRRDLDAVSDEVGRERVAFEVSKNHSRELVPGISLGLTRTDVRYRKFDGWVWLLPDRRTVWVKGQGAQQPVVFYSKLDHRPYELVITHVAGKSVAGYLVTPRGKQPEGTPISHLTPPHD